MGKPKKHYREIDHEMIKSQLLDHALRVQNLAERMSEHGEELTPQDRKMIRVAVQPWMEELMNEARIFYLTGQSSLFDETLNFIRQFRNIS